METAAIERRRTLAPLTCRRRPVRCREGGGAQYGQRCGAVPSADALAAKAAEPQALAAAVAANRTPTEFGRDTAVNPTAGFAVDPPSPRVRASTIGASRRGTRHGVAGAAPARARAA